MAIALQTVASGYNLSAINANFQNLQTALNNSILWKTGNVAGETLMTRDLDMNGNNILNLQTDLSESGSLITVGQADLRYYNITGDVLEGDLNAGQHQLKNLKAPTAPFDATRKQELDSEIGARQSADANIQEQLTGNVPLEASAFSQISWHDQSIPNSVNIPSNKNAWSFGPQMEIEEGQAVTIGSGSSWTIADGRVVEDEDLHNLIADTITTTDNAVTVNVANIASSSSVSSLDTRMTAEEGKIQPVTLGGTGAISAPAARVNLGLGNISVQDASNVSITGGSVTGITDLAVVDGGTGASTAVNARTNLGAAARGANSDITSLTGLTTALSVSQGGSGGNTAALARTNLAVVGTATNAVAYSSRNTGTGVTTMATSVTFTPAVQSRGVVLGSFNSSVIASTYTITTTSGTVSNSHSNWATVGVANATVDLPAGVSATVTFTVNAPSASNMFVDQVLVLFPVT